MPVTRGTSHGGPRVASGRSDRRRAGPVERCNPAMRKQPSGHVAPAALLLLLSVGHMRAVRVPVPSRLAGTLAARGLPALLAALALAAPPTAAAQRAQPEFTRQGLLIPT